MPGEMNTTYAPGSVTTATAKPAGYSIGGSGDSGMLDFLKEMVRRRQSQAVGSNKINPLGQAYKPAPVAERDFSNVLGGKSARDIEMERMQMQQMAAQTAALTQPAPQSRHIGMYDYGMQPDYEKFTGAQRAVHMPGESKIGESKNLTPEEVELAKRRLQPPPEPWSLG